MLQQMLHIHKTAQVNRYQTTNIMIFQLMEIPTLSPAEAAHAM